MIAAALQRACDSRAHCRICRTDEIQRRQIGFPDVCPNGFTVDNLPDPKSGVRGDPVSAALAEIKKLCKACEKQSLCAWNRRGRCEKYQIIRDWKKHYQTIFVSCRAKKWGFSHLHTLAPSQSSNLPTFAPSQSSNLPTFAPSQSSNLPTFLNVKTFLENYRMESKKMKTPVNPIDHYAGIIQTIDATYCQTCDKKASCAFAGLADADKRKILEANDPPTIAAQCPAEKWGSKKTHFVYPWIESVAEGDELKLSLRSVMKNFIGQPFFWIIGDRPKRFRDCEIARYIPQERVGKERNFSIMKPLLEMPDSPDEFCYMNDDIYFTGPVIEADLKRTKRQNTFTPAAIEKWNPNKLYRRRKRETYDLLLAEGLPLHDSGAHLPQWFEKSKMLTIGKKYNLENRRLLVELLYFCNYEKNPEKLDFANDGWFYRMASKTPEAEVKAKINVAKFFNHSDKKFLGIEKLLIDKFLRSSPLEYFAADRFLQNVPDGVINDPRVILEVGSRDAIQSCEFSSIFPTAAVYAFECHPTGMKRVRNRIASAPRVKLVPKAASDFDGQTDFHCAPTVGTSSLLKLRPEYKDFRRWSNKPEGETIRVDVTRVDTWAEKNDIEKIDLAWIDVQGAELAVLKGFGDLLKSVAAIWVEVAFKDQTAYENQPAQKEVVEFMESAGFVDCGRFTNAGGWDGNIIFVNSRFMDESFD